MTTGFFDRGLTMVRVFVGLTFVLVAGLWSASADDPSKKLTAEERKELVAKWEELNTAGIKHYRAGQYPDAIKTLNEALGVARRLYPKDEFPDGHAKLANSLNNLALLYQVQGKLGEAEPLFKDALAMNRSLFPGDHPQVAISMNNLAVLYQVQGKLDEAEPLFKDALAMRQRLFRGDHPDVAGSLGSLALQYKLQGKLVEAERMYQDALAMYKRLFPGDHPHVATSLNNLAVLYKVQGKLDEAEQLYKDTLAMRKRLHRDDHPNVAKSLNNLAALYEAQGKLVEAEQLFKDALAMQKRLFRGDHPDVVDGLANLASLYKAQAKLVEAEPLFKDALAMSKRLFPRDHPTVANNMNNMAGLYRAQGKLSAAEPLYQEALVMRQRLFQDDHPDVANSLHNLAALYEAQGKLREAELLYKKSLAMRKRLFHGDHPAVANSLESLAILYKAQGKLGEAEPNVKDALAMRQRLFPGDHPDVANSLNNLAALYDAQGKLVEAELNVKDALAMQKRLYSGDHPEVAISLCNLAAVYEAQGKLSDAEMTCKDALAMSRRLSTTFAQQKTEGEALTYSASLPLCRDAYLTIARQRNADPAAVFAEVWFSKAAITRIYEQRLQAARAAAADPQAAKLLAELAETRRRRAELIFAPQVNNPATRQKRSQDIKEYERKIGELELALRPLLPSIARSEKLARATPAELQAHLPANVAMVDFLHYVDIRYDKADPGKAGGKRTPRYLGFVVSRDRVGWVDLGPAAPIEAAINTWREAIVSGREIPASIPGKVRELVWAKVRQELPAGVKSVYICPDLALCRVPWAALPGDRPGTILLEDYALATIPHGSFLLDQLWPADARPNRPAGVLVVGGVDYQAELPDGSLTTFDLPVKTSVKSGWSNLPGAAAEATGVAGAATKMQLASTILSAEKATVSAVLGELPNAKYAHLATHGFFADESFRSALQLDPRQFEMSRLGERVGAGALSPLVMTGVVLAGANNPKTASRGIITGESLIDLDLSGLELAVLSACETGLGDVAGGEGTFGLQRAFHMAGTRNVVASLWKVPDRSTAALMALFYRNLWEKNLSPLEALRQAQLEIYRNPQNISALAEGFRSKFEEVGGVTAEAVRTVDGKGHPRLWAAFSISGVGR